MPNENCMKFSKYQNHPAKETHEMPAERVTNHFTLIVDERIVVKLYLSVSLDWCDSGGDGADTAAATAATTIACAVATLHA